jgi:hypothetical protein
MISKKSRGRVDGEDCSKVLLIQVRVDRAGGRSPQHAQNRTATHTFLSASFIATESGPKDRSFLSPPVPRKDIIERSKNECIRGLRGQRLSWHAGYNTNGIEEKRRLNFL